MRSDSSLYQTVPRSDAVKCTKSAADLPVTSREFGPRRLETEGYARVPAECVEWDAPPRSTATRLHARPIALVNNSPQPANSRIEPRSCGVPSSRGTKQPI